MTAHSTAKGIASLGRHGDDLIVHMNQEEVQGLQALARQHGTSLTINPHTGMPEAFKLGGVFKALLPMAAGFALGPGGLGLGESMFGAGSFMGSALGSGLLVGGLTALGTGNIGTGIMAGLGAYGGHGLSDVWSKMGGFSGVGAKSAAELNAQALGNQGINVVGNSIQPISNELTTKALEANVNNLSSVIPKTQVVGGGLGTVGGPGINLAPLYNQPGTNLLSGMTPSAATTIGTTPNIPLSLADTSKTTLFQPSIGERFTAAGGKASQLYMPAIGAIAGGVEPTDLQPNVRLPGDEVPVYEQTGVDSMGRPTYGYVKPSQFNSYRTLNLSGPGPLTLAPAVGASKSFAVGGNVGNPSVGGGLSDLYNRPEGQALENISNDGYGIGRLNTLAAQESLQNAKTLGYAKGGYLDGPGDGMSDSIPATINGRQPARLADGEFVVSADVVSHLGNGSTKAGSKKLYAMMDKVRKARTGTTKQGRQINPDKYLPA